MEHSGEKLEIGRTLGFAMQTVGAGIVPFALLVLVLGAANALIDTYGGPALIEAYGPYGAPAASYGISVVSSMILTIVATYMALRLRFGGEVVVRLAAVRAICVYGLELLGILLGLVLLVVPGMFLSVCWVVALPALMAEDLSITGALSRSWQITKGHRWPLFGLMLLIWLPILLLAGTAGFLATMSFGTGLQGGLAYNVAMELGSTAVGLIYNTVFVEAYITLSGQRDRLGSLHEIFA